MENLQTDQSLRKIDLEVLIRIHMAMDLGKEHQKKKVKSAKKNRGSKKAIYSLINYRGQNKLFSGDLNRRG